MGLDLLDFGRGFEFVFAFDFGIHFVSDFSFVFALDIAVDLGFALEDSNCELHVEGVASIFSSSYLHNLLHFLLL